MCVYLNLYTILCAFHKISVNSCVTQGGAVLPPMAQLTIFGHIFDGHTLGGRVGGPY